MSPMKQLRYYLVLFLLLSLMVTPVMSGFSGQYSKWEDRTGLIIEYKVDGADLESQQEKDTGIDVLGTLTPGTKTLTVSGTFYVDDQYTYLGETIKGKNSADATISIDRTSGGTGDGGQLITKTIHIEPPAKIPFSYSIQIPNSDLTDAGFSIGLGGNYPPGFIARPSGIGISGSFLRSGRSSVGSSGGSTGSGNSGSSSSGSSGGTTGGSGGGGSTGIGIGTIAGVLIGGVILIGGGYLVVKNMGAGGAGTPAPSSGSGPQTPPTGHYENGQPYWGTGTEGDPFREYPDAKNPPYMPSSTGTGPIYGEGTAANPYRDYDQGRSIPSPTPATPPQPPPAPPKPSKTSKPSTTYKPAPKKPKPPSGPKHGDTKTVTDSRGQPMPITYDSTTGKWMTDHGTEVDSGRIDQAKKDYEKDKDWSRDEHEKIVEKSVDVAVKSFQPPPKPQMSQRTKDYLKGVYTIRAKYLTQETNAEIDYGNSMDRWVTRAERGEFLADLAIDTLANVTGPVGKSIKEQYKVTKSMAKNLTESYVKNESILKGVGKGLLDIGFDKGFEKLKDKGLKGIEKRFNPMGASKLKSNLINPQSGDISKLSRREIFDVVTHNNPRNHPRYTDLNKTIIGGVWKTSHGQMIKYGVKDPLKTKVGLKKPKK